MTVSSVSDPRFSVCIPNFNYAKYLALTCESVTSQSYNQYEIIISDNQSTDGSIEFIQKFAAQKQNVRVNINHTNLGFASNLEKATALAKGDFFILLSSDDLMNKGCLDMYAKTIRQAGILNTFILGSSVFKIDSEGNVIERSIPDADFWKPEDVDTGLSRQIGRKVYKVSGKTMLQRSLKVMGNPYYFLTVCYPKPLFEAVGGYAGGRMYNPDKWFNWKLFSKADFVLLIDEPLFSYRWHAQNQVALETSYGHLRYLVDEYRNTIELTDDMLRVADLDKKSAEKNFIKRSIYRHGIGEFLKGRWLKSLRIFFFGLSVFPSVMIVQPHFLPYVFLLLTTPLGSKLASVFFKRLPKK
jgi:glycosyltransferase involved in cell wall biosynthesis